MSEVLQACFVALQVADAWSTAFIRSNVTTTDGMVEVFSAPIRRCVAAT